MRGTNGRDIFFIRLEGRIYNFDDDARIEAKVTCNFTPDGSWNLRFDEMWVAKLLLNNGCSFNTCATTFKANTVKVNRVPFFS